LDAKADPTQSQFIPYPAWYFLDLFGLLQVIPGSLEIVGAIIIPGIATTILVLLPWIDRSTTRTFGSRKPILWMLTVSMVIILGLTFWAQAGIQAKEAVSSYKPTDAAAAPPPAGAAVAAVDGSKVYATNCSSCHGATGQGTPGAFPPLAGNPFVQGDVKKVTAVVSDGMHGSISVKGATYNGIMPAWKTTLKPAEIDAVVTYIRTLK
jgi:mono/diheme cytochrome c family protein